MTEQIQVLNSFDYLCGVTFGLDLYDLTEKDLEVWMRELTTSDYEVVIFNVGCFFQQS